MPPLSNPNSAALGSIKDSFERFNATVAPSHARQFQSTAIQDVHQAAEELERLLEAKKSLRGLRRLQPLLRGLGPYAGAVEVLCNGTPYMPWIWVNLNMITAQKQGY